MRRLFSRLSPREIVAPELGQGCAHGCPACPHPSTFFDADDDGASTLLPVNHLLIDGGTLELSTADVDAAGDFDLEAAPDFDLD